MIRALRRRHRAVTLGLAVLAPGLFVAGLAVRPPAPRMKELPGLPDRPDVRFVWRDDLWNGARLRTGIARDRDGMWLAVEPLDDAERPDSLLYYAAQPFLEVGADLPEGVFLLGSLRSRGLVARKPAVAGERYVGTLLLYNLAEHRVIGWAPLGVLAKEAGP